MMPIEELIQALQREYLKVLMALNALYLVELYLRPVAEKRKRGRPRKVTA